MSSPDLCDPESPDRYKIRRITDHVIWDGGKTAGVLAVVFDRARSEEFETFISEDQLRESREMNTGHAQAAIDAALRAIGEETQKRRPGLYGPSSIFQRGPGH